MIAPKAFKFKCPQCGFSKIIKPKSDVLDPRDMMNICPKCKINMKRKELNILEKIFTL